MIPSPSPDSQQRPERLGNSVPDSRLNDVFDSSLDRALASAPHVEVPEDFATRVATAAAQYGRPDLGHAAHRRRPFSVGLCLSAASLLLLLLALVTTAAHAPTLSRATLVASNLMLSAELLLLTLGLAWWQQQSHF